MPLRLECNRIFCIRVSPSQPRPRASKSRFDGFRHWERESKAGSADHPRHPLLGAEPEQRASKTTYCNHAVCSNYPSFCLERLGRLGKRNPESRSLKVATATCPRSNPQGGCLARRNVLGDRPRPYLHLASSISSLLVRNKQEHSPECLPCLQGKRRLCPKLSSASLLPFLLGDDR
ncbi:hypothetical protein BD289DRAFT_165350 [Coniella lustricola]|uniref:Uncharacterized protein n=1 Tax=Coniella lustricola TaxID=2025994 RepID=A0A2T2ZU84_9PEZI|nr:hypothetical protein BD289DRAFT_165350 [Coniella lustricola]